MRSFFSAKENFEFELILDGDNERKVVRRKDKVGNVQQYPVYSGSDKVSGTAVLNVHKGKKIDYREVKVELVGLVETFGESPVRKRFLHYSKRLESGAGVITKKKTWNFSFDRFEKLYDSYHGTNAFVRYVVLFSIVRGSNSIFREKEVWVHKFKKLKSDKVKPTKLEVGIKEFIHIDFTLTKSKYHLKDVILGQVWFYLAKLKINSMVLTIIKKEVVGRESVSERIGKYEIMDGSPVRGENIPVRFFLEPLDLDPTMKNIERVFSVTYNLHLALIDEHDKKYYKRAPILLYRKKE